MTGHCTEIVTGHCTEIVTLQEFDRQASRRVRALFEQIDSMLFEDCHGAPHLHGECRDWVTRFPHLR